MSARETKFFPDVSGRDDANRRAGVALSFLPRLGGAAFREGVERHGAAADAFYAAAATRAERATALRASDDLIARCVERGAGIVVLGGRDYPQVLLDLPQPPSVLFTLGSVSLLAGRRVGIVGTRHSSSSGERIAYQIAGAFARAGVVVVSGMAFGIDAAAHRGALDAGGGTIAVLGGGADMPYPPSHAALHERIVREGLVMSEAPIGSRPGKGAFPRRNRIIAALSETLIVVEAGDRSGALITSRIALELGRNVAAVPGPIDSPRHVGSNRLLSEGASFIGRVDDALSIAEIQTRQAENADHEVTGVDHEPSHDLILNAVRSGVSEVEDLARSTNLPPREFATALSGLELSGALVLHSTGAVTLASRRGIS